VTRIADTGDGGAAAWWVAAEVAALVGGGIADPDGSESVDGRRDSTSDRPDGAVSIRL
jgi:hypothetical protein